MKNLTAIVLICISIIISSCVNDRKEKEVTSTTIEDTASVNTNTMKKPAIINDVPWSAVMDSTNQKFSLTKSSVVDQNELNYTNVLEALNRKYPEVKLYWEGQQNDTVYVKIPNSTYLTQQSGSLGSRIFLAESTYSLTEIPGVNVVYFNFKIGDHANPGYYKRTDFNMP